MVETSNEELQWQRLQAEREKLTAEQREQHDQFCDLLKANGTYSSDIARKAARIIATEEGLRQSSELRYLVNRAEDQTLEESRRAQTEADRQAEYLAQKAERQRVAQEQEAARLAAQEPEQLTRAEAERDAQRIAAHEAARREPIPGSIDRFDATLTRAQEAQRHEESIERLAETRGDRPNYSRFEKLKTEQAERDGLAGKGYDDMYTPRPNGGPPRSRGGRGM